jgi:hypothetical protein
LNTEIGGLLALPLIKPFEGLFAPVNLYWVGWDGSLEWYNLVLLIFYLGLIAVGLGAAWRRAGWIGLVPLAFNLGYALANGISRFSSWRYNLPVDWVIYFYFALGMVEILHGFTLLLGAKTRKESDDLALNKSNRFSFRVFRSQYIFVLAAFAFIGSTPWLATAFAKPRYTATQPELVANLETRGYSSNEVSAFLDQPGAVLLEGRMLYPRMYRRNEGMISANPWPAYAVKDYARIGFVLLNDHQSNAIFVTRDLLDFPQGADAITLGCQRENYIEVRVIDFGDHSYKNAPLTQFCN